MPCAATVAACGLVSLPRRRQGAGGGAARPGGDFYEAAVDALQRLGRGRRPAAGARRVPRALVHADLHGPRRRPRRARRTRRGSGPPSRGGPRLAQVRSDRPRPSPSRTRSRGRSASALELAREAAAGADAADLRTRSYARFVMGVAYRDMGRLEDAIREHDAGARLFATEATGHEPGLVYRSSSACAVALGSRPLSAALTSRSPQAARRCAWPRRSVTRPASRSHAFLGYAHLLRGDLPAAIPSSSGAWPSPRSTTSCSASAPTASTWRGHDASPATGHAASNTSTAPSTARHRRHAVDAVRDGDGRRILRRRTADARRVVAAGTAAAAERGRRAIARRSCDWKRRSCSPTATPRRRSHAPRRRWPPRSSWARRPRSVTATGCSRGSRLPEHAASARRICQSSTCRFSHELRVPGDRPARTGRLASHSPQLLFGSDVGGL